VSRPSLLAAFALSFVRGVASALARAIVRALFR
jgi:hypothetical protein